MVGGKDVIKRRQIASHISAQWIVAEITWFFYHWLYRQGVLEYTTESNISMLQIIPEDRFQNSIFYYFFIWVLWPFKIISLILSREKS